MTSKPYVYAAAALTALGLWGFIPQTPAAIVDLSAGGTTTINGAVFNTINFQPAGSGVIQPFVRIQNNGNEAGYNTSLGTPLDVLANSFHSDLLLSSLLPQNGYYDFRLDLNQNNGSGSKISLNQVQIFGLSGSAPTTWTADANGRAVGFATGTPAATLLYDMNSTAAPTANGVTLDFALNGGGSGKGDMQLLVPTSALAGYTHIVLYSQFGNPPGAYDSNDGFEEWTAVVVPEPTNIVAAVLLLLPFGAGTWRVLRKTRSAVV